jgi:Dolichyl-phosphate-mannose-protein mannosyltransferase
VPLKAPAPDRAEPATPGPVAPAARTPALRRWLDLRRAVRPAAWPAYIGLAVIVAGGLVLRLYGNRYGLPFVYHADEALHYTSRAIGMSANHTLDPGYFQNPSGFTYLVYAVLRLQWGDIAAAYRHDPSGVYHTARCVSAAMSMLGVAAVYGVGRRLWGVAEGLAAAAVLAFAFLPVAYSRFAVTDVSVLAPVAIAAYFIVRVREDDRMRFFVLAGAATGLAVGFKYTAGVLVVPLLVAALPRGRRDRAAAKRIGVALAAATIAFLITTPYFLLDLHKALYQLKVEQKAAANEKFGQGSGNPFVFYVTSLRWAFGWGPAIAALAGFVVELRRDRPRALLLVLLPLLLAIYLSVGAGRWFARWLIPAYPVLALFAGVGFAWLARSLGRRPAPAAILLVVLVAAALVEPVVADLHTGRVLSKTDTRTLGRDFLFAQLRPGARIVVDPAVPQNFFGGHFQVGFGPPPKTPANQAGSPTRYIAALSPARIEAYRRAHYCVVVTMSLVSDRALLGARNAATDYYQALPREGRVVFHASPYAPGAKPVPFDFDFSTHLFYPSAYARPGPEVTIYRLDRCTEGYGKTA